MDGKNPVATALFILLLNTGLATAQQPPRLLADVNQQPWETADPLPSEARAFVPAGDRLVFSIFGTSDDGSLWATDGTPQGTAALPIPICPSPCQSITPLATTHGFALLRAESGTELTDRTVRLWRTDGTLAGTVPLTEPLADVQGALADGSLPGAAALYFVGCRAAEGCELWASDGTAAGTAIVGDLRPGPGGSNPHALTAWRGRLYFLADDGRGTGLWSTDGTAGGTALLTPVQEGSGLAELLAATPSRLFFTVGANREALWASDGTAAGTRRAKAFDKVRRCRSASGCPVIQSLGAFGDEIVFTARDQQRQEDQYWSSDGTEAGTRRWLGFPGRGDAGNGLRVDGTLRRVGTRWVLMAPAAGAQRLWTSGAGLGSASVLTGCDGGCPTAVSFVATEVHSGGLLFVGADSTYGQELWITDGTGAGTRRLTDACPGACSGFADGGEPSPGSFAAGTYVVATPDPDDERELWATDGTPEGTRRIAGPMSDLAVWGALAFFGSIAGSPARGEVWATDGTAAGTRQVAALEHTAPGSDPLLASLSQGVVMLAREGSHRFIWGSDATAAGTRRLSDVDLGSDEAAFAAGFFAAGGLQFYEVIRIIAGNGWQEELWRSDGTPAGTRPALAFPPLRTLRLAAEWNGRLLFQMEGPAANQCAWWTSDGTAAGTREILPFPRDVRCATGVQPFGSQFLFVARTGAGRKLVPQLFVSDGTPTGTRQISRVQGSRDEIAPGFARAGGTAFFLIVSRGGMDAEVWRTDGTLQGTRQALALRQPSRLFGFQGSLYLTAGVPGDARGQLALWRLPLDSQTPVLLHTLRYGPDPSYTPLGDRLLFVAEGDANGVELWGTDGTPQGTALVSDVLPGGGSSMPTGLTAAGGKVFFAAHDGEHGWEPWETDGTAAGTRMVQDLNPGPFSSMPAGFVVSGSNLFFAADDGVAGVEPWVMGLGR